jgi:ATP-binding cassette, subfamily B, multidrug efflux pump
MKKLLRYIKPYWYWVVLVIVLLLGQALAELNLPRLMSTIVDEGIAKGDVNLIIRTGGTMLIIAAAGGIFSIITSLLSSRVSMGFSRDLRNDVFTQVERLSLNEFNQLGPATLITRTTNDITQVQMVFMMSMRMMAMAPMMAIGGVIMAISQDVRLSVIILAAIPILAGFITFLLIKGIPFFRMIQTKIDNLNLVLRENLTGVRVIRAFSRMDYESSRFDQSSTDLMNTSIKVNTLMAYMMPVILLIMNLAAIALIWFGGMRINQGDLRVGALMAFIQYANMIMFSLVMVSIIFVMFPRAQASADRINEVLDVKPEITDPATPIQSESGCVGCVEFQNVSFSYPGAEQAALCDLSFEVHPGEITAIIGGTGSGKSTLINLIPRFTDVTEGKILLDGVDIRDMSQEKLRSKIGFVSQQAILFSGSITENIQFGKPDASAEEIQRAADIAQASEFISTMPDGFETKIDQGGVNVSGGQKQRLSIARALVRKPEIYIFDDSFSALDFKTDAKLRAALRKEIADATVIIVAQRVSTVLDADRILVLEDGQLAGNGTHQELIKTCDVYREIVSSQLSEEELA